MRRITLAEAILVLGVILTAPALGVEAGETKALFPVKKQGKYGFIDRSGKTVLTMPSGLPGQFRDGVAHFQNKQSGYIDRTGKFIWPWSP